MTRQDVGIKKAASAEPVEGDAVSHLSPACAAAPAPQDPSPMEQQADASVERAAEAAKAAGREGARQLETPKEPAPAPASHHSFGGLSGKLLLLTVAFVMLAEIFIYVPSVANFRNNWLMDRLTTAGVAAAVLSETNTLAPRLQDELLRATGAVAIALDFGSRRSLIARSDTPVEVEMVADLGSITPVTAIAQSFATLFYQGEGYIRVVGKGQMGLVRRVDIVLPIRVLQGDMLSFSWRILGLSLVISVITAGLVYISLRALFLRPLQQLTRAMDRFAEAPEDPSTLLAASSRRDEIGDAQARLAVMQEALARALQQKRRLAELGLAVSKINHDLRNLLASAQLFAERLEHVEDPTVRRLVPKVLATLDRAVGYTQAVMAYGKAQEEPPRRRLLSLRRVVDDVADVLGLAEHPVITFECNVDRDVEVDADAEQLFRVLVNLCRNAAQALEGDSEPALVRRICVSGRREGQGVVITVADTGPGIPPALRASLFRPFHSGAKSGGVGLGLVIAAEVVRAHGGDIRLEPETRGTIFTLHLPDRPASASA